jgi:hypothetical protein
MRQLMNIRGCIQKFPNWLPGARTANSAALCHQVQLYRYFVSQSSEFCRHNPSCFFSTSVYCCCSSSCLFRYRLSPETFRYTLVYSRWLRQNRGSSVSIVTKLRAGRPGLASRQRWKVFFLFATAFRLALRTTQPPIQPEQGGPLSPGVKLTTHLHLLPRLRMRRAIPPLPHTSSSRAA